MDENKITLLDDEGVEKEFELVISFDIEDKTYVLLSENEESDDVFPFVIKEDENGEETLYPVESEAEFALIEETYEQLMEEDDDIEDGECNCNCGCDEHHHE
ncbi:MAG: DUF1292 domain-containing protein [Eubacterium sp.]